MKSRCVYVGTSGYQYEHWRGKLYPPSIPKAQWLEHYAKTFGFVEINHTFYQLPEASTFEQWRGIVPRGFCFAVKYSRFGTHMKKLKDPDAHLEPFVERAELLGDKLGPILVQLPPRWKADPDRLDAFLRRARNDWRWAVEFRDPSWLCEAVYAVLRRHNAALCIHDLIDDHPRVLTADWSYLRFHGPGANTGYPHQRVSAWADRIAQYRSEVKAVYAAFNNDAQGHAVTDAKRLSRYLGGRRKEAASG